MGIASASDVLFGNPQKVSAQALGLHPLLSAVANRIVATGQQGQEGNHLRYVFFHSLALGVLVGILVYLQA
jgi:lactate permease